MVLRPPRPPRPSQVRRDLERATAVLQACQQAHRAARDAIETAIRGMGPATLDSVLLLLPPRVGLQVGAAAQAVARELERALDQGLGLGR